MTWKEAVVAWLRPSDRHLSDDEIFEILKTGGDRAEAADLFAAKGVTLPMYFVWKSKYRHLTLEELRQARRFELWRARFTLAALIVAAILGGGAIVYGLARAVQVNPARMARDPAAVTAPAPTTPAAPSIDTGAPSRELAPAEPALTSEPGYKIQIAAAPTAQQAELLVQRLTSAGYTAYLSRATVSNHEVFRVRVGPFDTLPEAEAIASRLHRDGYTDAWIAR